MTTTTMPTRIWADRMPDQPSGIWSPAEAKPWHSSTAYVREDLYRTALARVEALEAAIERQLHSEAGLDGAHNHINFAQKRRVYHLVDNAR